jgi:4-hydroxybenzoyl-CoA thioesterase/acyl-CoA thioester hydrolase
MNTQDTTDRAFPIPLTRAALSKASWSHPVTFRHGHCDPAGIVYTPQFFHVFNEAIEAWFGAELGITYYDIIGPRRTGLGYVSASSVFFLPCRMGEQIDIHVTVARVGRTSYSLTLHAMLGDSEALRGEFTTVTTSLDTHRPIPVPEDIRRALTDYSARCT